MVYPPTNNEYAFADKCAADDENHQTCDKCFQCGSCDLAWSAYKKELETYGLKDYLVPNIDWSKNGITTLRNDQCTIVKVDSIEDFNKWFVDFEFPISKEYALEVGKPKLEDKPYNSSSGEMVWNDELNQEIPKGWEGAKYENSVNFRTGKLNSNASVIDGKYPFFTCSAETFKTNTYAFDCEAVLLAGNNASAVYPLKYFRGKFDAYQRTYVVQPKNKRLSTEQIYFSLKDELEGFKGTSSGTATKFLTKGILNDLKIVLPTQTYSAKFKNLVGPLFFYRLVLNDSFEKLLNIQSLLLSKMTKLGTTA